MIRFNAINKRMKLKKLCKKLKYIKKKNDDALKMKYENINKKTLNND